jgi:hypothetical protein
MCLGFCGIQNRIAPDWSGFSPCYNKVMHSM